MHEKRNNFGFQVGHKPAALFSHMQKSGFLMTGLISYLNIGLYVQQVEKKRQKDLATGDNKVQKTAKMCEGHVERKVSMDHVCKMSCVVRKFVFEVSDQVPDQVHQELAVTEEGRSRKLRDCTNHVEKAKKLISYTITAQQIYLLLLHKQKAAFFMTWHM